MQRVTEIAVKAFYDWYVNGTVESHKVEELAEQIPNPGEAKLYVRETLNIIREHPYRRS